MNYMNLHIRYYRLKTFITLWQCKFIPCACDHKSYDKKFFSISQNKGENNSFHISLENTFL